ncbi:TetR family transcriptional regulator C-terminal domain-containing protein [Pseudorhodoferax sp.]|uniref:TetR/AcrR family transcriptional regulator n=1 Tax=Pseudorhodoferax sp. TaxID=1993553 RepID=UPI0039E5BD4D
METQSTGARRGPKPRPHVRENLLRLGVKMLHEGGYTATGIKDIVDAAQVPKGSFYNYFENKEAFGKEAIDLYFESGLSKLRELLCDEKTAPLERLRNYFELRVRGFRSAGYVRGCLLGNFSLEVADHSPLIRDRLAVHFRTWSSLFESCIEQAQQTGAIRNRMPAALLAQFLLNSWEGALLRMRAEKSDVSLNQFIEVVFGSILV